MKGGEIFWGLLKPTENAEAVEMSPLRLSAVAPSVEVRCVRLRWQFVLWYPRRGPVDDSKGGGRG